ncbi:inositol monophosphatase family protein [Rubrobacter aplysinae]|uniref:inositol monophosphatase family protein n=1 Tax=Rubrobacter aplysinae TaxID=909625 RepID=UPI00064BF99A|nr:inositol monophosphatase [Rubrobacter aplysinae]
MSRDTIREELHGFVCDVARSAGELQLSRYERPGEITEKEPKDLVTEVDYLCEELLISRIQEFYPEDAILSEERGGEIAERGRSWLLDPVDGTANFSRANPLFCVCVSVVEDGEVTHAAVAAPRVGDLYHAYLGGGAYRSTGGKDGERVSVSDTAELEYAFTGADLSFTGLQSAGAESDPQKRGLREVFSTSWQLRALGSAGIRGAWTAAGYLDVSIGTRNTLWDYATTALLVSEAGGRCTDSRGEPWNLDSDALIATNGRLHDEVIQTLSGG